MFSLEATLFLLLGFATSRLLTSTFLDAFIIRNGHLLIPSIIPLIGFAIYVWLEQRSTVRRQRWQFVVATIASLAVIAIIGRMQLVGRTLPPGPIGVHDGAVQSEEAAKFLIQGENPYAVDYRRTPFGAFGNNLGPQYDNVAWTHYAYPPANFLLTAPFLWLHRVVPWSDSRTLYTLAFLAVAALLVSTQSTWPGRSRMVLLTLGNPLIWMYAIVGFNDILMALGIIGTAVAAHRQKWIWSGITFGLAVGTKQTAWLMIPLWLLWLGFMYRQKKISRTQLGRTVAAGAITGGIFLLPFFFWSPADFYDDLIRYVSGTIPLSYPVSGMTLQQYFYIWRFIPSPLSPTPTLALEAAVGLPVLALVGRWIKRRPTAGTWLAAGIVLSLSMLLVNRYFNENYVSGLIAIGVAAYALSPTHDPAGRS